MPSTLDASMQARFSDEAPSNVVALLGFIAAILLWWGADELRVRVREADSQVASAAKRVSRGSANEVAARQRESLALDATRHSLSARLASDESEQMTRAKLVFELRQKCNAVPVSCQVRLADMILENVEAQSGTEKRSVLDILDAHPVKRVFKNSNEVDEWLRAERDSWDD